MVRFKRAMSLLLAVWLTVVMLPAEVLAVEMSEEPSTEPAEWIGEDVQDSATDEEPELENPDSEVPQADEQIIAPEKDEEPKDEPISLSSSDNWVSYAVTGGNIYFDPATGAIADCDTSVTVAEIPAEIAGTQVTAIENYAFEYCSNLTRVEIPKSIKTIGSYAFYKCTALQDVVLPSELTELGASAFYDCNSLTSVSIPEGISVLGSSMFYRCKSLSTVTLPEQLTKIDSNAFYQCESLTDVDIPNSVSLLGYSAFEGCKSITVLSLPSNLSEIGSNCFSGCSSLTQVSIPDAVIGSDAFENCPLLVTAGPIGGGYNFEYGWSDSIPASGFSACPTLTNVVLPGGLKSIGNYAFSGCEDLQTVVIPKGVTDIGDGAFYGCNKLENMDIPDSVERMGESLFESCTSLKSVTLPSSITEIGDESFYKCEKLEYINIPSGVTTIGMRAFSKCNSLMQIIIPGKVSSIEYEAFDSCLGLESVTVCEGLTALGEHVFDSCSNLATVNLPKSLITINDYSFYKCSSLININIPSAVTSIGSSAFSGCTSLKRVTIPEGVACIDWATFSGCIALESVSLPSTITTIDSHAFSGCSSLDGINIPVGLTHLGEKAFYNCTSLTGISLPEGLAAVYDNTFYGCSSLREIAIPSSVSEIGECAFYGCTALQAAVMGGSSAAIGNKAFEGCTGLTTLAIEDGITDIGERAFYGCSALQNVSLPKSMTSIGASAFYGCASLQGVEIPQGVTAIQDDTFNGCTNLAQAIIPDSVQTIGRRAFYNCAALTEITIPDGVKQIPDYAFSGCTSLTKVEIPKSVTYTSDTAFQNTPCLTSQEGFQIINNILVGYTGQESVITIPNAVIAIGDEALSGNSVVTEVTIPSNVNTIGRGAFSNCHNLTRVVISDGVTTMGENAFKSCERLEYISLPSTIVAVPEHAFIFCKQLKQIVIPEGITEIGHQCLSYCDNLENLTLPESLIAIAPSAFNMSKKLNRVNIPSSVKTIGYSAFEGCTALTDIILPDGLTYLGRSAFSDCSGITEITIPSGITSLERLTFDGCTALAKVTLPQGLTTISDDTFRNCSALGQINIPSSVISVSADAFSGAMCLETRDGFQIVDHYVLGYQGEDTVVSLPQGTIGVGSNAFYNCAACTEFILPQGLVNICEDAFTSSDDLTTIAIPESVSYIDPDAFGSLSALELIRYAGTPDQWRTFKQAFRSATNAVICCDGAKGNTPSAAGTVVSLEGEFFDFQTGDTPTLTAVLRSPSGSGEDLAQSAVWTCSNEDILSLNRDSCTYSVKDGFIELKIGAQALRTGEVTVQVATSDGAVSLKSAYVNDRFAGGDGTPDSPYQIRTARQLSNIKDDLTANYVLLNNIDCFDANPWNPIGAGTSYEDEFAGVFDGQGHTISGITSVTGDYRGLFGCVDRDGIIKNVRIENFDFYTGDIGGMISGENSGTIENCVVCGTLSGSRGYYSSAIGGITGRNSGTIRHCISTCNGDGLSGGVVGGIAGKNYGTITACEADVYVQSRANQNDLALGGGIAGWNSGGTISLCETSGEVESSVYYAGCAAGGIAGANTDSNAVIEKCYFHGTVYAHAVTTNYGGKGGGIVGSNGDSWLGSGATIRQCVYVLFEDSSCSNVCGGSRGTEESNYNNEADGKETINEIRQALGKETENPEVPSAYIAFLSDWDAQSRRLYFDNEPYSLCTLSPVADTTGLDKLIGQYVLVTTNPDSPLVVSGISPVDSAIGTVSASGEHSMTIDGTTYPVREDLILYVPDGAKVLYHLSNSIIVGFTQLEKKTGSLESWNGDTGIAVINGREYYTNYLSDLSNLTNAGEAMGKKVEFLLAGATNYDLILSLTFCPGFRVTSSAAANSVMRGNAFDLYVGYYLSDGSLDTGTKQYTVAVSNGDVLTVDPAGWDDKYGQRFTVLARNIGAASITFTHTLNGEAAGIDLQVIDKEAGYRFSNVPKFTIEPGKTTNFYNYNGLVVDDFAYTAVRGADGEVDHYDVTMTVYNTLNLYGAVTAYNAQGEMTAFYLIDKKTDMPSGLTDNIKDLIEETGDLFYLMGNKSYYSGKSISQETKVSIEVPAGGYIEISNSGDSVVVVCANIAGLIIEGLIKGGKIAASASELDGLISNEEIIISEVVTECLKGAGETAIQEAANALKNRQWTLDNYGAYLRAFLEQLKKSGPDMVDAISKKINSLTGIASIAESAIMSVVPTGKLVEFLYNAAGLGDQIVAYVNFWKCFSFSKGICIYAPAVQNAYISNGITVVPAAVDPDAVIHSYRVVNKSEAPARGGELSETYSITMYKGGQAVQAEAPVKVSIPLPQAFQSARPDRIKVYRLEEDGTATDMRATIVDGHAEFTTDHFSYYSLVVERYSLTASVNTEGQALQVTAVMKNTEEQSIEGTLTLAVYDDEEDGKLLSVQQQPVIVPSGESSQVEFTVGHASGVRLKAFWLKAGTCSPISAAWIWTPRLLRGTTD